MKEDEEKEGKKKKRTDLGISLKALKCTESSSSSEEDDDETDEFKEVEYLIKRFHKFFSKERGAKEANKKKSKLICYVINRYILDRLSLFEET